MVCKNAKIFERKKTIIKKAAKKWQPLNIMKLFKVKVDFRE